MTSIQDLEEEARGLIRRNEGFGKGTNSFIFPAAEFNTVERRFMYSKMNEVAPSPQPYKSPPRIIAEPQSNDAFDRSLTHSPFSVAVKDVAPSPARTTS